MIQMSKQSLDEFVHHLAIGLHDEWRREAKHLLRVEYLDPERRTTWRNLVDTPFIHLPLILQEDYLRRAGKMVARMALAGVIKVEEEGHA